MCTVYMPVLTLYYFFFTSEGFHMQNYYMFNVLCIPPFDRHLIVQFSLHVTCTMYFQFALFTDWATTPQMVYSIDVPVVFLCTFLQDGVVQTSLALDYCHFGLVLVGQSLTGYTCKAH